MTQRVITYIDGFNLYYGLKEKGWRKYYWLNLKKLALNLLEPNQELIEVKYFTARITTDRISASAFSRKAIEAKRRRQSIYLEALSIIDNLTIFEGHFLNKILKCQKCGNEWSSPEEKMTDVNIATELLSDSFDDRFDIAHLVSGDSDLAPPLQSLLQRYPGKKVIVAFPPRRYSERLKNTASDYFYINETAFRQSIFPDEVTKPDGYVLKKPPEWT
jgi:uncharacterized LabA/DUF88 family protein